jgi:hypothetical protein
MQFAPLQLLLLSPAELSERLLALYLLLKLALIIFPCDALPLGLQRLVPLDAAQHVLLLHQSPPVCLSPLQRPRLDVHFLVEVQNLFVASPHTLRASKIAHRSTDLDAGDARIEF